VAGERVTDAELREILADAGTTPVANFIADAHIIVDDLLLGKGLSEDRLKLIEKYYAAHLYTISAERGGIIREKIGESDQSYVNPGAQSGLRSSRFGQVALGFDTTGILESMLVGGQKKALFRVVGPADTGGAVSC
jgi:hypothetical protein